MLFNSLDFAVFLPVVFGLYWLLSSKGLKIQNLLIVAASYLFYGWWDWRFLILILLSTVIDFSIGLLLSKQENIFKRKLLLWSSIIANIGLLGFFKYFNFFLDNFIAAFSFFGHEIQGTSLSIIIPVGISFYTFQTLSYTIDVYKRKLKPTKDFVVFSAFVSFFPQLVAGPIERASNLLPQFYSIRVFNYSKAIIGMRLILWGLFKKIVIADNCAEWVNLIFSNYTDYSGSTLLLGVVLFAFQIYGDFSGYSDIAIGTAKLFGFDLKQNFAFPYFSRNIAEFWRRWHISLSTWFRDYLYIPLGGSRGGNWNKVRNTFIIFLVSGFWHGANWTFIFWGALNAFYFLPLLLTKNNRNHLDIVAKDSYLPSLKETLSMLFTFMLISFAWIFFRADSMDHAFSYISGILSSSIFETPEIDSLKLSCLIPVFLLIEWLGRKNMNPLHAVLPKGSKSMRWLIYVILVLTIFYLGNFEDHTFIYFQF